jgi:hypothetical protein
MSLNRRPANDDDDDDQSSTSDVLSSTSVNRHPTDNEQSIKSGRTLTNKSPMNIFQAHEQLIDHRTPLEQQFDRSRFNFVAISISLVILMGITIGIVQIFQSYVHVDSRVTLTNGTLDTKHQQEQHRRTVERQHD